MIEQREQMVIANFFNKNIPLCDFLQGDILHRTCNAILNNAN